MNKLKLFSLFAGCGAPEMALKRLGIPLEIVGFSEIDKYAVQSYRAIHGEDTQNLGDIKQIERLPKANLVVYGSPCLTGDTLVEVDSNEFITIKKLAAQGTENRFKVLSVNTSKKEKRTLVYAEGYNCHMTKRVSTLIKITRGRESFKCTPEHKVLLPNCKWIKAQDLKNGDYLWGNVYEPVTVEVLKVDNEPVYDLTVPKYHNFMIKGNFCVHNCQDFSVAGKQRGLINENGEQTRSGLLLEVERLVETAKVNNELPEILLMENVKNLVSKKFKPDFERWLAKLEELGYNNYYSVLNAKDYGIPQNRERVFVMSLRKDIDKRGYKFPEKMPLTKRLMDVLEDSVDEKYYLSEKCVQGFLKHNENHNEKGTGFLWKPRDLDGYASCLRANGALCPTDNTIAVEKVIGASRGRNPENPSDRTVGAPTEQRLEINSQGVSNTLTTVQKDNLVVEMFNPYNNKKIEDVAPCQTTGCRNTTCSSSVLIVEKYESPVRLGNIYGEEKGTSFAGNVWDKEAVSPTLTTMQGGNRQPMILENKFTKNKNVDLNVYREMVAKNNYDLPIAVDEQNVTVRKDGTCGTLTTDGSSPKKNNRIMETDFRIRRLTPLECWRLMDFSDEDFNKAKNSGLSNTQLYKIAGNSIVVACLYHIFRKLFIDFNEVKSDE